MNRFCQFLLLFWFVGSTTVFVQSQDDQEEVQRPPFGIPGGTWDSDSGPVEPMSFEEQAIKRAYEDPYVWKNLKFIRESPSGEKAFEFLMFSQEQIGELEKEREQLLKRLKEIDEQRETIRAEWAEDSAVEMIVKRMKSEAADEIGKTVNTVLLPNQAKMLSVWTPQKKGIFTVLAHSPIGTAVGLSESDRKKMTEEFRKIGEKHAQSYITTVLEARRIVEKYVPEDQLKRLEEHFYPGRGDLIQQSLMPNVILTHLVPWDSPYKRKMHKARRGIED